MDNSQATDVGELSIGKEVVMGRFPQDKSFIPKPIKWRIIDCVDNRALLIAKDGLIGGFTGAMEGKRMNFFLNEFYNYAFSTDEKKRITHGDIKELVFLLSKEEVEKYRSESDFLFADSGISEYTRWQCTVEERTAALSAKNTDHEWYANVKCDIEESDIDNRTGYWMLRDITRGGHRECLCCVSVKGEIRSDMPAPYVPTYKYLRPAMWRGNAGRRADRPSGQDWLRRRP